MPQPAQTLRMPIELGNFGLFGVENQTRLPLGALIDTDNITFETGAVRKAGGASKFTPSALAAGIVGGWSFRPVEGSVSDVVVLSNGDVLLDNNGNGDYANGTGAGNKLADGLTLANQNPWFVQGGDEALANPKKLFMFTGANPVKVLAGAGTVMTDISSPPADWTGANQPVVGLIHENRLWAAGNANRAHTFYYSTTTDHEDFTGSGNGIIQVFPGKGDRIVGAISFRGFIFVYKSPRGVYAIDTRSTDANQWRVEDLSEQVGVPSPHCVVGIDNDVLLMSSTGDFHLTSQVAEDRFNIPSVAREAGIDEWLRQEANQSRYPAARGIYYAAKRQVMFGISRNNASVNDAMLVLDLNDPNVSRFHWSKRDVAQAIWLKRDTDGIERPVIGDDAGNVWNIDEQSVAKDGQPYPMLLQLSNTNFSQLDQGLAEINKNGKFLELAARVQFAVTRLSCDVIWDGQYRETVEFVIPAGGFILDQSRLDVDRLGAGRNVFRARVRFTGSGRELSLRLYNTIADQTVVLYRLTIGFLTGSETLA